MPFPLRYYVNCEKYRKIDKKHIYETYKDIYSIILPYLTYFDLRIGISVI